MFLLGYFSRTAWFMHNGDAQFPRERFAAFRECEDDYLYVPAGKFTKPDAFPGMTKIGECENPVLGRYVLLGRTR